MEEDLGLDLGESPFLSRFIASIGEGQNSEMASR
jgi:hypothetical protein